MTASSKEDHLLYVLLDSNLPTGGFVASSGLESYAKHGFFSTKQQYNREEGKSSTSDRILPGRAMMDFAESEVHNYASTTLSFVNDTWQKVDRCINLAMERVNGSVDVLVPDGDIDEIIRLDQYHEATMLSHVARRSSKAQGVAMLTLYTRGLSHPAGFEILEPDPAYNSGSKVDGSSRPKRGEVGDAVVEKYKRMVRAGKSPGHLAICWGVITAALGLSLDRALHLHLFLHARSLLSSAVRLNIIGPYASSQLLLHPMKDLTDLIVSSLPLGINAKDMRENEEEKEEEGFWDWAEKDQGPYTTWPLGEVLTARHDLQHSRIFNS